MRLHGLKDCTLKTPWKMKRRSQSLSVAGFHERPWNWSTCSKQPEVWNVPNTTQCAEALSQWCWKYLAWEQLLSQHWDDELAVLTKATGSLLRVPTMLNFFTYALFFSASAKAFRVGMGIFCHKKHRKHVLGHHLYAMNMQYMYC